MKNNLIKCSLKKHEENGAIIYCQECKIYMCNKCNKSHSDLFGNHHQYVLEKDIKEIFTGFCKEKNHYDDLEYYCKTHNLLCCAKFISKFKNKGSGKHGDCEVCLIEDIKEVKKEKLNENFKSLEDLSNNIQQSIDKLKKIFEKINLDKEEIKLTIQKVFSQLRNKINEREDELLSHVDKKFNKLYFKEELIKDSEILPTKIKTFLEKCRNINNEWNDDKLISLVNDCINIENIVKDIKSLNNKVKRYSSINYKIDFFPKKGEIDFFSQKIKNFGKISHKNFKYSFRECPINIDENKRYEVQGINQNILTKKGKNSWIGILCQNELKKNRFHAWKIEPFCNTKKIIVGVAPSDFDINYSSYQDCGWYLCCCCDGLFSGAPHNYKNKKTSINFIYDDDIIMIMDTQKGILKCIIGDNDEELLYTNIPLDKPLFPAVFLRDKNDSIEIINIKYKSIKKFSKEKEKKILPKIEDDLNKQIKDDEFKKEIKDEELKLNLKREKHNEKEEKKEKERFKLKKEDKEKKNKNKKDNKP